jgi:hypothetical protein
MIADRMRWGKRSKAKQGKLVASPQTEYGFRYNETRVVSTPTPVDTRHAPCSSSLSRNARSRGGGKADRCLIPCSSGAHDLWDRGGRLPRTHHLWSPSDRAPSPCRRTHNREDCRPSYLPVPSNSFTFLDVRKRLLRDARGFRELCRWEIPFSSRRLRTCSPPFTKYTIGFLPCRS